MACALYNVSKTRGLYIGLGAKIVGARRLSLGQNVSLMPQCMVVVHNEGHIEIGRNTNVSMYSRVAALGFLKIGNNVEMGPHVFIADYNHEYRDVNKPIMFQGNAFIPTKDGSPTLEIGDDSLVSTKKN